MSQVTIAITQKILFAKEKLAALVANFNAMFTELYAHKAQSRMVTKVYTIGALGVTGCDFNFAGGANTTAQPKDLGEIIPAFAQPISVVVKTTVAPAGTGISAFGVTGGTQTGGVEFFGSTDLFLVNALAQPAVGAGYTLLAVTNAARKVWIGGAPTGGNWAALTSLKLTVYVTYLDNAAA